MVPTPPGRSPPILSVGLPRLRGRAPSTNAAAARRSWGRGAAPGTVSHLSRSTERSYVGWVRRYILFHGKRHPAEMAEGEINAFLTHLAVEGKVSASTQTQALCALLFLYRHVLGIQIGELEGLVRARRPRRLPLVLTQEEVRRVLGNLRGVHGLVATLLYGGGLRLQAALTLTRDDKMQLAMEPFFTYTLKQPGYYARAGLLVAIDAPLGFGLAEDKVATLRLAAGRSF